MEIPPRESIIDISNLIWTFMVLNLHQMTDSKAQLSKTNVINHKSNNLAGFYQEDTGVIERLRLSTVAATANR